MSCFTPPAATQVDAEIARLRSRKEDWLTVDAATRVTYLRQCMEGVMQVAEDWVAAACQAKGIDPKSELAGEEWIAGPATTLINLRSLIRTLEGDRPSIAVTTKQGQQVAQVLPDNLMDRLLWLRFKGEIWMEPGKPVTQGTLPSEGRVALVLGAGNIASTPPMDTLYKLFAENQVVLLKMNPVNGYVGAFLKQAFQPLIRNGFLAIASGGADLGSYLCQHPDIDTIHITGSDVTHDAIVWGQDSTRQTPVLTKPITSELGCVTPILVTPGNWSKSDLKFQARHVASMVVHNASFNCVAGKLLVTAKGWHQREAFLNLVRQELAKVPSRKAYYPGAQQRYQGFLDRYPQAEVFSERTTEVVPWTLIPDVSDEYALQTEAFCGVLAEVSLEATTGEEFLTKAVPFVNDQVWGNLSCILLIDGKTQSKYRQVFEAAIADLKYGGIAVNVWSGILYALPDFAWGAFPGNTLQDIRSGRGLVHNAYLFDHPQKSVVYAPFRILPLPFWFPNHRSLGTLGRLMAELQMNLTWGNFLRVGWAALKG
jgi:acyl-CoA reductase-like NAD-dependent aldehyde dehydrogenase